MAWRVADGVSWRRCVRSVLVVADGRARRLSGGADAAFLMVAGGSVVPSGAETAGDRLAALDLLVADRLVVAAGTATAPGTGSATARGAGAPPSLTAGSEPPTAAGELAAWTLTEPPGHDRRVEPVGARAAGVPLDLDRVASLVGVCRDERIVGVLVEAVHAAGLDVADVRLDELAAASEDTASTSLALEALAAEVSARLEAASIDHRLLKGVALAAAAPTRPGGRDTGDVDVLVPTGRVLDAVAALGDLAQRAEPHTLGPAYDDRFGKGVTLVTGDGWEVDLHRTLAPGPWGFLVPVAALWDTPGSVVVAGRAVPTLAPGQHLAHAVLHAALGDVRPRLQGLRDVVWLDRSDDDVAVAAELLARSHAAAPARWVARQVRDRLGVDVQLGGWVAAAPAGTLLERGWLRGHRRDPRRFGLLAAAAVPAVPRADRRDYLAALVRGRPGAAVRRRRSA